ncbi:MAG TPA: hypothetical protein DCE56_36380 [Cyanobacteria bacterium UBA8553]|nr:hypothetical protein [Cyanobacteria bacterium UBA8553]HAJ64452.1 hypothetical protein [Cyanobacteria bacterium UBA8543]
MSLWQEVLTTALVGTQRRSLSLNSPTGQLGDLLSHLNPSDPEGLLLSAAAAISLYQQAGQLPVKDNQPLPDLCPPDELPCCSICAGQHLRLMLLKERQKLLPEWLSAAAKAKKRASEYCLPGLLELGRNSRPLRFAILPVLGKRGRWLAAQNPDWDYVVSEDIEETWKTGSGAARQLLVQQLRIENPADARERVAAIWEQEKSDERLAFIETFHTSLSMDDEPFLEAALDDRRKEVRQKAAQLLAHLPQSRLCQRMSQQVRSSLILKEKRNRLHLDFTLSEATDQELTRDGIDFKQPPHLLGEKAWKILQIVAATPLSVWYEIKGELPSEWIQAAKRSEWDRTLIDGWAVAALRQQNVEWVEALLSVHGNFNGYLVPSDKLSQGLIGILSPEQRNAFFLRLLQSSSAPFDSKHPAFLLVCQYRYPWSVELSRAVIEGIQRYLTSTKNSYDWSLQSAFKDFACYIAPSLAPELLATLPAMVVEQSGWASYWRDAIDEFLSLLNFRSEMLKEFED